LVRDPACVFCKIIAVEIPAAVVFENDAVVAFLDVGPLARGHLLVAPREHYARLSMMPAPIFAQIATVIPSIGRALLEVTGAEGFNLLANDGSVAGQVVPHVHFHFIPRRSADGLGYRWNAGAYAAGEADEIATAYRTALLRQHA
jgi:histidine triad (HIT) family protein